MQTSLGMFFMTISVIILGMIHPVSAEPIQVKVRVVDEAGKPIPSLDLRLVIGSEKNSRSPDAGKKLRTGADGSVLRKVDAPIKERKIQLDSAFARHNSKLIEIGVEVEFLGRRALYWIEIDQVKAGPLAGMNVFLQKADGPFDQPLKFHPKTHSWSHPDPKSGMMLTSIGVKLLEHDMKQSPDGTWMVHAVLEKQKFEMR